MRKIWTAAAALAVLLAVTGLAWAALPSTTLTTSQTIEASAGAAGSVTLQRSGDNLTVAQVRANAGWTFEIEQGGGDEVEIDFRNADLRIQFNAELEDGQLRIRLEERSQAGVETQTTVFVATSTSTTSTTQDEDEVELEDELEDEDEAEVEDDDDEGEFEEETRLSLPILDGVRTVQVDGFGSLVVSIQAGQLALVSTNFTAGCLVSVEEQSAEAIELEISCPTGEGEVDVEIEGGELRVRTEAES